MANPGAADELDDDAVFAALYSGLRRLAAVTAPLEVDPDDLVQEALVRVLRRGPLTDLDDPGAHLGRVIVNLASNSRRSLGRRRAAWSRHGATTSEEPSYPSDLSELERLTPDERALLDLVEVERWTFGEAAAVAATRLRRTSVSPGFSSSSAADPAAWRRSTPRPQPSPRAD